MPALVGWVRPTCNGQTRKQSRQEEIAEQQQQQEQQVQQCGMGYNQKCSDAVAAGWGRREESCQLEQVPLAGWLDWEETVAGSCLPLPPLLSVEFNEAWWGVRALGACSLGTLWQGDLSCRAWGSLTRGARGAASATPGVALAMLIGWGLPAWTLRAGTAICSGVGPLAAMEALLSRCHWLSWLFRCYQ